MLPFDFPSPERPLSPPIIAMEGASVGYDDKPVLSRLSLVIAEDDRIGLLGSNGNGKSTFAKLVAGKLATMTGAMRRSQKLKVAYFAQHQLDELRLNETPYQHVAELMVDSTEAKIRARCARMGFPGAKSDTPVAQHLRRREGTAPHGPCNLRRPASAHPRRADKPSGYRFPRRL